MLFRLPTPLVNILSHFGFYKIAERMRIDSVLAALAFHRMTEVDWSSSEGPDEFVADNFATGT